MNIKLICTYSFFFRLYCLKQETLYKLISRFFFFFLPHIVPHQPTIFFFFWNYDKLLSHGSCTCEKEKSKKCVHSVKKERLNKQPNYPPPFFSIIHINTLSCPFWINKTNIIKKTYYFLMWVKLPFFFFFFVFMLRFFFLNFVLFFSH